MHAAWITQVGRRADQELIHDPEHGDVRADPESKREDHGHSEGRTTTESAGRVTKVLEQDVEPRHAAYIPGVVLDALDATERDPGLSIGFVGVQSGGCELLRFLFHVEAELLVQVILDHSLPEDRTEAISQFAQNVAHPVRHWCLDRSSRTVPGSRFPVRSYPMSK